jgi:hypothetical protein
MRENWPFHVLFIMKRNIKNINKIMYGKARGLEKNAQRFMLYPLTDINK